MTDNLENIEASQIENNPQDNGENDTTEEVYTAEQRRRHLEQLEGSKKEAEKKEALLVDTYKDLAQKDAGVLNDLYSKDPKLADKVAKEFWYDSYKELNKNLNPTESKGLSEDDLEDWYQKRRGKDQHAEALQEAQASLSKLPEDLREEAQEYFNDIIEGKTLTREKATKFANMATLYVSKDKIKDEKYTNALADAMSTWVWRSKVAKKDDVSSETLDFAKNLWFGKYFE